MSAPALCLAKHRLDRAREALRDAEFLLQQGSLISATNRFYYAAFYAARACLATKEIDSGRHSGAISLFQQHFVKTGLMERSPNRSASWAILRSSAAVTAMAPMIISLVGPYRRRGSRRKRGEGCVLS